MAINGVSNNTGINVSSANYESVSISAEITKTTVTASTGSAAAVYEKNDVKDAAGIALPDNHKIDYDTIDRLKAEADERHAQLKGLVEKMLLKQGGTFDNAQGLASLYRKLEVDEETRKQAQEDISEDGYWGVEQTSDRIVDFAKALAGDNPEIAKQMLEAVKEGFKQAGEEWGEDLPDISKKTMDATFDKLNKWIEGLGGGADSEAAASGTTVTATSTTVKISASYTRASESTIEVGAAE